MLTGDPARPHVEQSVHGSIHRARTATRDVTHSPRVPPVRTASPTPSTMTMSSNIVHTLQNGTKISVPTEVPSLDSSAHSDPAEKRRTFYIIPPGMNVIFKDGDGNEVGRVGDFSSVPPRRVKEAPIILKDENGRIIYETGEGERTEYDVEGDSSKPNVIHLGYYVPERYLLF
ncbi:hypothetical protein PENSPDRAFT_89469 [Peniophora sp. CONT]|nr:hypothetical protein PENSPDRAFT_89469 [Peniophora sp. CONT]